MPKDSPGYERWLTNGGEKKAYSPPVKTGVFNYSPHVLCGGAVQARTHDTVKPTPLQKYTPPSPPEGHYTTAVEESEWRTWGTPPRSRSGQRNLRAQALGIRTSELGRGIR